MRCRGKFYIVRSTDRHNDGPSTPTKAGRFGRGLSMSDFDPTFDRRIFFAYQQVKKARADGKYAAIVIWMNRVDQLLDERMSRSRAEAPFQRSA